MYLNGMLLLIFAATMAFLVNGGLWSNAIVLINVITAALLATNFFEPLAAWMTSQFPTFTYVWDFLSLWFLFFIFMAIFRTATDSVSKVKVKFKRPVDMGVGVFFAAWVGWILICFTTMTLHTAPLARNFLAGEFQPTPTSRMFMGQAPDRIWLGFMQRMSRGPFARSAPKANPEAHVFDPSSDFILKYGQRRADFEKEPETRTRK